MNHRCIKQKWQLFMQAAKLRNRDERFPRFRSTADDCGPRFRCPTCRTSTASTAICSSNSTSCGCRRSRPPSWTSAASATCSRRVCASSWPTVRLCSKSTSPSTKSETTASSFFRAPSCFSFRADRAGFFHSFRR